MDIHSFANVAEFRTHHLALDLHTDFAARKLTGSVELHLERLAPGARRVVLDTRDLEVRRVLLLGEGGKPKPLAFALGAALAPLGQPLNIELPAVGVPRQFKIRVEYATRPAASGLQWLTPAQTAGKTHPFLFSQSQAIHARSWIPLQDSPQVRATYSATIRTPAALRAVMSAAQETGGGAAEGKALAVHRFNMPQAIPSYLIAIAVGRLDFKATGTRTGVYAEPPVLTAATHEFADLEKMVEACEQLFGPYRWGRYDLLILPPSFPFGGMENPRVTFITPTVIAGDRSLVALIAHELAHSWSGNLVTNATWRDFWLNEGFTVYLERRIVAALYGQRREQMEDALGLQSLQDALTDLPPADQILAMDLRGRDPDDAVTEIAYEKGKLFLQWLESRVGRNQLDNFLRGYFNHFAFQSIGTEQFLHYLRAHLLAGRPAAVTQAELHAWIYEPGLPKFAVLPSADAFASIDQLREAWLAGQTAAARLPAQAWTTQEWLHFLNSLPGELSQAQLQELDTAFAFSRSRNAEIAHSWFKNAIRNDYQPAYPALQRYLVGIGRRKLIRPLYEELMKTPGGAQFARRVYAEARPGYHPIAVTTLDAILKPAS